MLDWAFGKNKGNDGSGRNHSPEEYEKAKAIAVTGSLDERVELAANTDLDPEFLYFFANDQAPEVRHAVANNEAAPLQADVVLAKDPDQMVRATIAEKISTALPDLNPESSEHVVSSIFDALSHLAQDALPHIRGIVADSIKEMESIPKPLITMLANDVHDAVAIPVLQYSPMLTTDDLLELIDASKGDSRLCAISKRSLLPEPASAAIVDSGSDAAIIALLENESARISDPSMDTIADLAESNEALQEPLVMRPNLPDQVLSRVVEMVSDILVMRIVERGKLDDEQADALRARVGVRMGDIHSADSMTAAAEEKMKILEAYNAGTLDEAMVSKALEEGRVAFVQYALCLLAKIPESQVKMALSSTSGKLIVAIVWKSGLSMKLAVTIQQQIARLPYGQIVHGGTLGTFPLTDRAMESLLEIISKEPVT